MGLRLLAVFGDLLVLDMQMTTEDNTRLWVLRDLCAGADDNRIVALTAAINSVQNHTVADTLCALAAMIGQILAAVPDDRTRDNLWLAFQALTLGHVAMGDALSDETPDQSTLN